MPAKGLGSVCRLARSDWVAEERRPPHSGGQVRSFLQCARQRAAPALFSGIKDARRVSQETKAPGDAREGRMPARQPQNRAGTDLCREESTDVSAPGQTRSVGIGFQDIDGVVLDVTQGHEHVAVRLGRQ